MDKIQTHYKSNNALYMQIDKQSKVKQSNNALYMHYTLQFQ